VALPVTSGSKGIHLYARLDGSLDTEGASQFARQVAQTLQNRHPQRVTAVMRRTDRTGKVFVDWSQNNGNKTTIAPYSLRGRAHAWVAAPRTWEELGSAELRQLEFDEVLARAAEFGDLLAPLLTGGEPDRLATYRSMRDAAKTSEPVPATPPAPSTGRTFVIQEHHARRLHYDFRLERDGVLASWAVPKGPPSDPHTNHLAVHVEDHPLAYGGFEGTIPKGEYGAGSVRIWDAGTYELAKWRDGAEVIVTLHGRPDGGLGGEPATFALIHTNANNWLIHRMRSSPSRPPGTTSPLSPSPSPLSPSPSSLSPSPSPIGPPRRSLSRSPRSLSLSKGPVAPMLAVAASPASVPAESQWAFEMKWDGMRAIVTIAAGQVGLTSRNGRDETLRYPDLVPDVAELGCASAVLDGEIVVLDGAGAPDFGLLQPRINLTGTAEIAAAAKLAPAQLMLFDLLELDGVSAVGLSYRQRRELLEQLLPVTLGRLHVPPVFDGDLAAALDASSTLGLEGVVAKRLSSTYLPGRRSEDWLKIKHRRTQSVVIGGWRPGEGNRAGTVGSLLVGIPDGDALRYLGRVGSGFSDAGLAEADTLLAPLAWDRSPFVEVPSADAKSVRWTRPVLVGEVQFSAFSSGGRLRHPVWLGWRPELTPGDIHAE
jgi:bifunctional non-homologous end joining protein LigD